MIIKNGTIIDPVKNTMYKADVVISGDKITEIVTDDRKLSVENEEIIDATGYYIAPGLVDTHVHFRDPGFTYKEDILSGADAAKKGGFTTVILMANTNPHVDSVETIDYVLDKGSKTQIRVKTCANVTMDMKGKELTNMSKLYEAGAVGFTDDGVPLLDEDIVMEAFKEVAKLDVPISFHEENPRFISENGINAGVASEHFGIKGSNRNAEIDLISRDINLLRKIADELNENLTAPKMVIQHISTKEGVELVREAKKSGLNVYAEATPHHFSLTEADAIKYGTNAKMNPPLRTCEDRLAIIEGLKDGTIDVIATDHAPHSAEEKKKAITDAPSGIIGLETSLSLGIMNLVKANYLTYPELIYRMSTAPCELYKLEGGQLIEDSNADLIIFNPDEEWLVDRFCSKSDNSPFAGWKLPGVIKYTICGGQIVYEQPKNK